MVQTNEKRGVEDGVVVVVGAEKVLFPPYFFLVGAVFKKGTFCSTTTKLSNQWLPIITAQSASPTSVGYSGEKKEKWRDF